jgi:hypothetical protein
MGMFQTVDVSSFASAIDLGNRYAELKFAYNAGDAGDGGTVSMRFLDASSTQLGGDLSFFTSNRPTAGNEWATSSILGSVPTGTRSIQFSLSAERIGGTGTVRNVSYDALTAQLLDTLPEAPPRDVVHGNLIQFVDNGAWSWFQDERAIVDSQHGQIIVGSIANRDGIGGEPRDGHVQTTHFDLTTGRRTQYVHNDLESYGGGDDHNTAGLLQKEDGNILAVYAAHNRKDGVEDDRSYYRTFNTTTNTWGAETEYHWWDVIPDNAPGDGGTTYSNVFQLSAEDSDGDGNGRLYNIARTQQSPHIMYSDDNGVTWEYGGQFTKQASNPPATSYVNGYYKYVSNGVDRIDLIATEFHPADYNNSIYHAYIQNGKLHDSTGNVIDNDIFDAATSFDPAKITSTDDFTQIFQSGATKNSRSWTTDIQRYEDGTIVALYKARAGGYGSPGTGANDHRVWYGRFDPVTGMWNSREIAKAGANLLGSEVDYTGLGAIHPHDPNTLYISTEIDPTTNAQLARHEIYKGVTADKGATWAWTAITENSSFDNLRPIIPAWDESNTTVLWWRGTMTSSHGYDTAVIGIIDRKLEKLGKVTYVDATTQNTTLANGSPFAPTSPTLNPGATDGNWHRLTGTGNGGSVFTADETGSEDAPTLKTTVTELDAGKYDVFAFFWSDVSNDWRVEAGLSQDAMNFFRIRGSQQAEGNQFDMVPILDEGNRSLYRGYVGRVDVASGESISVFINDSTGTAAQRAWYDGIGLARVLPIELVGDYNNDGAVDAADYTVWRDNLGTDAELPNDPIGGTIGAEQYDNWKSNFGATSNDDTGSSSSAHALPEPQSLLLLMPGMLLAFPTRGVARAPSNPIGPVSPVVR